MNLHSHSLPAFILLSTDPSTEPPVVVMPPFVQGTSNKVMAILIIQITNQVVVAKRSRKQTHPEGQRE